MKVLYFIVGCLIPLPIFYDLILGTVLAQKALENQYFIGFPAPVPIGIFSVMLLGLFSLLAAKFKQPQYRGMSFDFWGAVLLGSIFLVLAWSSLDIFRVISLVFPFGAMIFVYLYSRTTILFTYSIKGYIFGSVLLITSHVISIVFFDLGSGAQVTSAMYFSSIFGNSIYQAGISYSAVLSFFACTLIVIGCGARRISSQAMFITLAMLVYVILGYGARKAVLLDLFVLFIVFNLISLPSLITRLRIPKITLRAFFIIGLAMIYLLYYSAFFERELSYANAVAQRGSAYEIFWLTMSKSSVIEFLFGHGGDWGGYSNIFLELIYRLGVMGLMLFMVSFILLMKFVGTSVLLHFKVDEQSARMDYPLKIWIVFLVLSMVMSNSINMNLQLPYYVLNILFVSLAYLHWTREGVFRRSILSSSKDI